MSGLQVETKKKESQVGNKKNYEDIDSLFPSSPVKDKNNQIYGYGQPNSGFPNPNSFNMGGMPANQGFTGYVGGPNNLGNFNAPGNYQNNRGNTWYYLIV